MLDGNIKSFINSTEQYQFPAPVRGVDDSGKRKYITPEGKSYPSMTTVLSMLSDEGIKQWRLNVGDIQAESISRVARMRGEKIHLLAEKYLLGQIEEYQVILRKTAPDLIALWKTLKTHLDENVTEVFASEVQMWSDELGIAGTVDLICKYRGKWVVLDFKTSFKEKQREHISSYFMQCAGYSKMWQERTGIEIKLIVVLIATEFLSNTVPYYAKVDEFLPSLKEIIRQYQSCESKS